MYRENLWERMRLLQDSDDPEYPDIPHLSEKALGSEYDSCKSPMSQSRWALPIYREKLGWLVVEPGQLAT